MGRAISARPRAARRRALLLAPVVAALALLAPPAQAAPALALQPAEAPAGATVTVRGSGFEACAEPDTGDTYVEVVFDDVAQVADTEPAGRGTFTAAFTVPADAATGAHAVRARCWYTAAPPGPYLAEQPFRVLPPPTAPPARPVLRVDPATGRAGKTVEASGTGFTACPKTVDVLWDGRRVATARATAGRFATPLVVPAGAGPHVVGARCAGGLAPLATAAFTTLAAVAPPTGPVAPTSGPPSRAASPAASPADSPGASPVASPTIDGAGGEPAMDAAGERRVVRRAWLPASLPQRLDTGTGDLVRSFALAALLVLLVGFPAELFNKTVEENADRIRRALGWLPRGPRLRVPAAGRLAGFTVVAAVLTSFADPAAGWHRDTLLTVAGLVVAIPVTLLAFELPLELWCRRGGHARAALRVLPYALAVAGVLALVSRVAGFRPAYVYGLVAGYAVLASRSLAREQAGQAVLVGAGSLLGVSMLAWAAWLSYDPPATTAGALAENVLAAIAVVGVEGLVFALVPLRFLDGEALWRWGRVRWAVAYLVAAFVFVHVLLASRADRIDAAEAGRMLALFLAFGVGSLAFWAWFRVTPSEA